MLRIGHRGFPGAAPANTMSSFRAAHELGCDWVECDCMPSADGQVMLAHDDSVRDRSGRQWVIEEHGAGDLRALDLGAGEGVPTLAELVGWAHGRVGVMADVKRGGIERQIGETLSQLSAGTRIVAGADPAGRIRFRQLYPNLPLSTTISASALPRIDSLLDGLDTEAATLEHPLITPGRVDRLHVRGIRVYAWTVDDLPTMLALIDAGIDGLISNRADLLASLAVG